MQIFFFVLITLMVLGVGLVVGFSKNLLHSAFSLFFMLFGIAGYYVLLGGDFIAMVQLMVYAGGIAILLIFGTMLTADIQVPERSSLSFQGILAFFGVTGLLALLWWVLEKTPWKIRTPTEMTPTTNQLGKLLLQEYVFPFEVISFLLVAAMVGALILAIKGDRT